MRLWRTVQDRSLPRAPAIGPTAPGAVMETPRADTVGARASFVLQNSYVLDLDQQWAKLRGASGAGAERRLTSLQCQILYWVRRGQTIAQIAARMGRPMDEIVAAVDDLRRSGILALRQPGDEFGDKSFGRDRRQVDTLAWLWRQRRMRHAERPYMILAGDGAALSYAEAGRQSPASRGCAEG